MPKKTVVEILNSGNHYCIQVKGNQPKLKKQIAENIAANEAVDSHFSTEKNRGRIENRLVEIYDDLSGIDAQWKGLQRIAYVHRYGYRADTGQYDEDNYYILSLAIDQAEIVAKGIRGHWEIENRLHYVKDVVQNEDNSDIKGGFAIENLSLLKNAAINLFRLNGFPSVKRGNIFFANKIKKLFELISQNHIKLS